MNSKKINTNNYYWKTSFFVFTFCCLLFSSFLFSSADISKQINYQGKLTDSANSAVPDGSYNMIFKLYDADTSGTLLWTGTHTTANSNPITVTNGIFSVLLGSGTGNTLSLDFNSNSYYLQVEIYNSDTPAWETLTPRKQLGSVPSSFNSDRLDGLDSATSGANAHIVKTDSSGNLTISGNTYFNGTSYYVNSSGTANLNALTLAGNLNVNSNQFLVDTSTGFIGIGKATPTTALDVTGTVTATAFIGDGSGLTNLPTGLDGATWLSGVDVPLSTLGVENDFYLDTTTNNIYKKDATDWQLAGNIKGSTGMTGANGSIWYVGSEDPPAQSFGYANEFYLNNVTYNLYKKDIVTTGLTNAFTGGTATSSPIWNAFVASRALDGDDVTGWASSGAINAWWKYNFGNGNAKAISKLSILTYAASTGIKNYQIEGSNDDANWTILHSGMLSIMPSYQIIEFSNANQYQYYRIYIFDCYGAHIGISEMDGYEFNDVDWGLVGTTKGSNGMDGNNIYSGNDNPPNQLTGFANDYYLNEATYNLYKKDNATTGLVDVFTDGATAASSYTTTYFPYRAIDESPTSFYWLTASTTNQWWSYDFGEGNAKAISKFSIYPYAGTGLKDFNIEGSNDNITWDLLDEGTLLNSATYQDVLFANENAYRYYRIFGLNTYSGNIGIGEIRAYEFNDVNWRLTGNLKGADGTNGTNSLWANDGTNMSFMTGKVGIGDATPVALLTVGDGDLFQVNATGNVLGQSFNGLTLTSATDGFTISGGTTSRTLTINGANVSIDQSLLTTSAPTFATLNTGQGANELYAMNQNVLTTSSPTFAGLTLSGLTQGSVPFIGASGVISQDNTNLFWDNSTQRLGIGTTNPGAKLAISAASGSQFINLYDSTNSDSVGIYSGSGNPEGVRVAQLGSIYLDSSTGKAYKKSSGDGTSSGWEEFAMGGSTHMAKMTREAYQSISGGVDTKVLFDNEDYDVGGIADYTTNDRFVINKSGKYLVSAFWQVENMDPLESASVLIYLNGSSVLKSEDGNATDNTYGVRLGLHASDTFDLVAGDYLEMYVRKSYSGGTSTDDSKKPRMSVIQIDEGGVSDSIWAVSGADTYYNGGNVLSDQFIVANSATGGIVTRVSAGSPLGSDISPNGTIIIDSTNQRMYFRYSNTWHYVAQTAGFQIPNYEVAPPDQISQDLKESDLFKESNFPTYLTEKITPGELLIPYVDEYMQDGAAHGLYARFADVKDIMFQETDTKILTLEDANKNLDTKTTESITTLEEIKKSTTDQLESFTENIDVLGDIIKEQETLTTGIDTRVISLEDQMKTLKDQNEAVIDFAIAMNMESLLYKDALGNLDLGNGKLEAGEIIAGTFTVKVIDEKAKTIGEVEILPIAKDEDNDGNDDYTKKSMDDPEVKARDGKSVEVETKAITDTTKIFLTPQSDPGGYIWTEKIKNEESGEYIGFKINLSENADKNIRISWLIVETKEKDLLKESKNE